MMFEEELDSGWSCTDVSCGIAIRQMEEGEKLRLVARKA